MGEASYYLKARFSSEKAAKAAMPKLKEFINQAAESADWWQDHRNATPKNFWKHFDKKFPLVKEYLKEDGFREEDCNNSLADRLCFDSIKDDSQLQQSGVVIKYVAISIWHCADWAPFANFIKKEFGAKTVKWISDEHIDPFSDEHIDPFDAIED